MARVEWTIQPGDTVEELIAVMLLLENPRGTHVRPSRGDGGIDVLIPTDIADTWDVYQVKKFSSNLSSGQKKQIEKSIIRLRKTVGSGGGNFSVQTCWITLPLNPTPENRTWLTELGEKYRFDLQWYGLSHVNGLAANHTNVVDYYCHGGVDRLNAAIVALNDTLRSALGTNSSTSDGALTAHDVGVHFGQLQQEVNRNDPFFQYEFMITQAEPELADRDSLVASVVTSNGQGFITINILTKSQGVAELRPSFVRIRPNPTEDEKESFERMIRYGLGATFTADFEIVLPGGLGSPFQSGKVRVGPTADQERLTKPIIMAVTDSDGREIASIAADTTAAIYGTSKQNFSVLGKDRSNVFKMVMLIGADPLLSHIQLDVEPMDGRHATDVVAAWNLLEGLHVGNTLTMTTLYGSQMLMRHTFTTTPGETWAWIAALVRDLHAIQSLTMIPIMIPPLESIDQETRRQIHKVAEVARGETVTITWGSKPLPFTLGPDVTFDASAVYAVTFASELRLETAAQQVGLGLARHHLNRAVVLSEQTDAGGTRRVIFGPPSEDATGLLALVTDGMEAERVYAMNLDQNPSGA